MLPSCADVHRLIWFAGSSTRSTKSHQIHRVIHTEIHGGVQQKETDSRALTALVEQLAVKDAQLAKKDEQIAKLMETVADGTKAVQGAQALHHETAQALALESTEQKLSRWQRLRRAWRG